MADPSRQGTRDPSRGTTGRTREQIRAVALELFSEQGYDKTSLREIADRLRLTKAALYYHFRSKEEIVLSIAEDYLDDVDELIAWTREQPSTTTARREILRRYHDIVAGHIGSMQLFQQNPAGLRRLEIGAKFRTRMGELHQMLCPEGAPPADRIRAFLAVIGLHTADHIFGEDELDLNARLDAALDVGLELLV